MAGNKYLLDTHCLIWFQENNPKIPRHILDVIEDSDNVIFFSQISLFELTIKISIGKLPNLKVSIDEIYTQALRDYFTFLPIQNQHIYNYKNVLFFENHRDPFDRLLIATAIEEKAIIISADEKFKNYQSSVEVIWE